MFLIQSRKNGLSNPFGLHTDSLLPGLTVGTIHRILFMPVGITYLSNASLK